MNWSKTKTCLIIALAILNIMLIVSIYKDSKPEQKIDYTTQENQTELQNYLDKYNISLNAEIPKNIPELPVLTVEYVDINQDTYPKLFQDFGDRLDIVGGRNMILNLPEYSGMTTVEDALETVANFSETYFKEEQYSIKSVRQTENQMIIRLNPKHQDYVIDDAETVYTFNKYGALQIEKIQMKVTNVGKTTYKLITPYEAIIKSAPHIQAGSTIKEIKIIHYYSGNQTIVSTKRATAIPTWRIKTSDDKFYYIQAIGEL